MIRDPRGPNIIPIPYPLNRRSYEARRAFGRRHHPVFLDQKVGPEEPRTPPWPFNCFPTEPVVRTRFGNRVPDGVRLPPEDTFRFREDLGMDIQDRHQLEFDIDNVLLQFKHDHPGLRPLDLVPVLLKIVKKLLRMAKLPPR